MNVQIFLNKSNASRLDRKGMVSVCHGKMESQRRTNHSVVL